MIRSLSRAAPASALALALALAVALAVGSGIAAAQQPGGDVPVPEDLLAVLTLRGKPCGQVVDYQRQGDADYLVTCSDGHRYRVFVGPGDKVVVEER